MWPPTVRAAVHEVVCAERHNQISLARAVGDDHLRSVHLGDLDTEQRHASRAFDQHDITGVYATALDQCEVRTMP